MENKNLFQGLADFRYAVGANKLPKAKEIDAEYGFTKGHILANNGYIFMLTIEYCYQEIAEWMVNHYEITKKDIVSDNPKIIRQAAEGGCITMLKWLCETFHITRTDLFEISHYALDWPATYNNLHTLKWMIAYFGIVRSDLWGETFQNAANNGHLEIIKYVVDYFGLKPRDFNNYHMNDKVRDWFKSQNFADEEDPKNQIGVKDLMKMVKDFPDYWRSVLAHRLIDANLEIPNCELREYLDEILKTGAPFYYRWNARLFDKIIEVYDFANMQEDEIMCFISRIAPMHMLESMYSYLITKGIITKGKKDPSPELLKRLREMLPKYVIAQPDELTGHIAKKLRGEN